MLTLEGAAGALGGFGAGEGLAEMGSLTAGGERE